jgi:hypothetical protein
MAPDAERALAEIPPEPPVERLALLKRVGRAVRTNVSPARRRKLAVGVAGYAVIGVFALSLWIAHAIGDWSWGVDLAIGVVVAAPLALAFIYDRLTALRTPWFEIALSAATVEVEGALATALAEEMLIASGNPALIEAISAVLEPGAPKVIRVNLRTAPYWWSTRVYLLSALASDYTSVECFAFVEGGAARRYVGLAEPRSVRAALAARFPDYARVYESLRPPAIGDTKQQVAGIVGGWQAALVKFNKPQAPPPVAPRAYEESLKLHVTAVELNEWLNRVLDTGSIAWDGWPQDPRLRATILAQDTNYVALVRDGRLDRVVSRDALALAVARSAFSLG